MTTDDDSSKRDGAALLARLEARFGDKPSFAPDAPPELWSALAGRASVRRFQERPPDVELLRTLAALALCAPTKSDLQQRDVLLLTDPAQIARVKALVAGQAWIAGAPAVLVFCGNNRRQRRLHAMWDRAFANDHLDAFFNAAVDAGIAMTAFILAAEAAGLGTCPISAIRNRAAEASEILALPDHVFPVAALAVGTPAPDAPRTPQMRLPLAATVHENRYDEDGAEAQITAYDARRAAAQPYRAQRGVARFGEAAAYTWSDDKTRQYAEPERADFGAYVRAKGFSLD